MQIDLEHTTLFNGKVTVFQPKQGYRFSVDSLMLAAFTHVKKNQMVLELGIGVGAASLALAYHHPDINLDGVEIQAEILPITEKNIQINNWPERFKLFCGNLKDRIVPGNTYHHVMMNPPFFEDHSYTNSHHVHKSLSNGEHDTPLTEWIFEAYRTLRQLGYVTIVHTADRLDDIISVLKTRKFGGIEVYPLWPKLGSAAKRVLVKARKDVESPLKLHAGLILHEDDGAFTREARKIIFDGEKIRT
ncbi:MAG: methyltransferase [Candidatus Paracaedibacteraceae bacterium]|nr:methyltransferase [Candidatus Paracaedibacteraceae bacterium]